MEKLSVTEILENVKNEICNNYYRFPEKFSEGCEDADEAWDDFYEKYCNNCPLNLL